MVLIHCPECGKEISDKARSCPSCGHPVRIITADPPDLAARKMKRNGFHFFLCALVILFGFLAKRPLVIFIGLVGWIILIIVRAVLRARQNR